MQILSIFMSIKGEKDSNKLFMNDGYESLLNWKNFWCMVCTITIISVWCELCVQNVSLILIHFVKRKYISLLLKEYFGLMYMFSDILRIQPKVQFYWRTMQINCPFLGVNFQYTVFDICESWRSRLFWILETLFFFTSVFWFNFSMFDNIQ